ncbi:polymeric immunoglobulin receptor-like [Danio rerio]|uniref:polymeric immunoglobulin receptor-like n=1 Tax=Danio rerio TaxID=7955 RepID=UPI003CE4D59F
MGGMPEMFLNESPECITASVTSVLTVQTGGSVVVPCYYDMKYAEYKKYWCFHANNLYSSCSILAYANETKGKVSVVDHPDQSFFTVTMRNLQHGYTGYYWCAVEIGGIFELDQKKQLYLSVQSASDVFVVSSSVSGHEGDDVSVQCFYSSEYKKKLKRWCRYKDQGPHCFKEKKTDTSQNSSVQISDDGERCFTVLMTGLRLSDSGWYFCSAGEQIILVQLTVTKAPVVQRTSSVSTITKPKPAVSTANSTESIANSTVSTSNSTESIANSTVSTSNSTESIANSTVSTSNSTESIANSTVSTSNSTASTANSPVSTANSTLSTANSTESIPNSTVSTANRTASTANSIASTANSTASTANSTLSTANSTVSTDSSTENSWAVKKRFCLSQNYKSQADPHT